MPYSAQHKAHSREKILHAAVNLFAFRGYDQVSLDELMQEAGLTRGAFYAHFNSKQELYAEAILTAAKTSAFGKAKDKVCETDEIQKLVNGYLSEAHVNEEIQPCHLAFLVSDVAKREPQIRRTYTQVFKGLSQLMQQHFSPSNEQQAMALVAMMIGGVAVGRAIDDEKLRSQLLETCRQVASHMLE